jgi:alkylated DNA repair dioxygenase AlkB
MNVRLISDFGSLPVGPLRDALPFRQATVRVYGKEYPQPRLVCWFGPCAYTYSGLTLEAAPFPKMLEDLRVRVSAEAGEDFNSVLCNLYRNGEDYVSYHSDDEPLFGNDPVIASLSFGETRRFKLRRKDDHKVKQSFDLTDGSLLIMGRGVQPAWQHSVPKARRSVVPRINLTFRRVVHF